MNKNKFLTLLMGKCWHELKWEPTSAWSDNVYLCTICGERSSSHFHPDHLSNPLPVIRFMEKEMPDTWEGFLYKAWFYDDKRAGHTLGRVFVGHLNFILNLSNLIQYLSEHREWGKQWVCNKCGNAEQMEKEVKCWVCGKGEMLYIKHLALKYMEECDVG